MKALVKQQAAPGIWLEDIPEPKVGPNDVLIEIAKTAICGTDMHIYNWDAWAQKTIPGADGGRPRVLRRASWRSAPRCRGLKTGDRVSGEGHITCGYCRNCRAGRRHLCRNTIGVGVNRPGCLRASSCRSPPTTPSSCPTSIGDDIASILDPFGNATHTALAFNVVGEDVLITGAGPIGIMADRGRALRRCPPRRGHRRERLPPGAGAQDGRDARHQRAARLARPDHEGPRHAGGLRRRAGDVRQCGRLARDAAHHAPRRHRSRSSASRPRTRPSTGTR